jgi:lysophospholipase L1-like esterase
MNSLLPQLASLLIAGSGLFAAVQAAESARVDAGGGHWVASWTAAPQPVWAKDFLFPSNVPEQLQDQTLRQVARLSLGGNRVRLVFSNAYGDQPMHLGRISVAIAGKDGQLRTGSLRELRFDGRATATLAAGAALVSDPVELKVPALARLAVSIHFPGPTPVRTFHWDGRQTAWLVEGDQTGAAALDLRAARSQTTTARVLLSGIEVESAAPADAVAVIGDSITDGATASLDADSRWPDVLAERLAPRGVAVINAGISGGRLLSDGMGESALARLQRDVLSQPGVRTVVVLIGINDIAWPGTAFARDQPRPTLDALQAGYQQLARQARRQGVRVIGMTLAPFEGALPDTPLADYYQQPKDALRRQLNDWIRSTTVFDAVIDADRVLRDPARPQRLLPRFDSGDHLHPGDAGNQALAEAVDLDALLAPAASMTSVSTSPHKE